MTTNYIKLELQNAENFIPFLEQINPICENLGIDVYEYNPDQSPFINEQTWLLKNGLTEVLLNPDVNEAVIKADTVRPTILSILQVFLDAVITTDHLTIIDPYFFFAYRADADYCQFVNNLLSRYVNSLTSINFITDGQKDNLNIKNTIENDIKAINSTISINYKNTDKFHDRFWISDFNNNGLIMGSSLNTIGRKYSIVDYLKSEDVSEIHTELAFHGLL